ncbi:MAG: hypothetical protein ABH863_02800 [Candidatus Micrarchaeota archaeon]
MRSLVPTILILFAALIVLSHAQDAPPDLPAGNFNLQLQLRDSGTSNSLGGYIADLRFSGYNGEMRNVILLDELGVAHISLDGTKWLLIANIDAPDTPGNDYFGMLELNLTGDSNITLHMMPVGSVSGIVLSNNRTVQGARIALKCPTHFYDMEKFYGEIRTDEFGSFAMNSVPAKNCELFARSNGMSGRAGILLSKGDLKDVQILLTQESVKEEDNPAPFIAFGGLLLLIIGAIIFIGRKKPKEQAEKTRPMEKKAPSSKTSRAPPGSNTTRVTQRMRAIIGTLNGNERRIIEFLIQNGGIGRQNKVYHALLIPKVTLSRAVFSLENKNIIKTKRIGKVKELELTEWFLE